jgi:hypothetical protein
MNKKEIVIIGSYANHPYKLDLLNDCIDKIKPLGFDIMLVSHYPIPFEVQKKVDYVVYDKENILQDETSSTGYWFQCNEFNLVSYNNDGSGAHALAVVSNINNGVNYANYLKYEFFFYLECDNHFDVEDLTKIQILKNSMFLKSKNMIVFNHLVQDFQIYETLMFGGNPKYFVENICLPKTNDDFSGQKISLERFFYDTHKQFEESFYVVASSSEEYFSNSEINKDGQMCFVEVMGTNDIPNLHLFIKNNHTSSMQFKVNGEDFRELCANCWHLRNVGNQGIITVTTISNGIETIKEFVMDDNILDYYKKGYIHFN